MSLEKDGIKENMTVIADEGLVGYVISVTENTAKGTRQYLTLQVEVTAKYNSFKKIV